jgi:RNA polymerase sigma factor (sigma-70 family)
MWTETVEWLYEKHFNGLHRRAYRTLFDKNKAADVIQEVFTRLLEQDRRFADKTEAEKFLFTSFRNLLIDHIRRDMRWKYEEIPETGSDCLVAAPHQEEDLVMERTRGKELPLPESERGICTAPGSLDTSLRCSSIV